MEILHQLAELFLQAVPTVVIVFLFYLFMRWAFFTPIQKAMAEREAKIEGARREAAALEAEAGKELQDYNERLRKVRGELSAEQVSARHELESQTDSLAAEIVRVILEKPSPTQGAVR